MQSQDVKQLKENVSIHMQNMNLQQSLRETNVHATNISRIYLAKNRHMIKGLADD